MRTLRTENWKLARQLYKKHKSLQKVAKLMNVAKSTVHWWVTHRPVIHKPTMYKKK